MVAKMAASYQKCSRWRACLVALENSAFNTIAFILFGYQLGLELGLELG